MPVQHYNNGLLIVGSDGVAPVHEPDSPWKRWAYHEIFKGPDHPGTNKYVPKIKDRVLDVDKNIEYEVVGIDSTTLIAELREIKGATHIQSLTDIDLLIKADPCIRDEVWRVYLDTSVNPYRLTVDAAFKVYGSMAHHAIIYRGIRKDDKSNAVSMIYDQYGQLLSQSISLELAQSDGNTNHTVKSIPPCHTTVAMPDGELVTVVIYDDVGVIVNVTEMVVVNTSVIRQTDTAIKYIRSISLESPFLSENDPTLIKYPMNVPVRGWNLFGVVNYSDGSKVKLPVDGRKFSVLGINDYISTVPSAGFSFTLRYSIGRDEIAVGIENDSNIDMSIQGDKFMTRRFRGETVDADNAYSVKLFGYPKWIDDLNGYRMHYYLLNLERSYCIDVTSFVKYNANRVPFNGLLYGVSQRLSVSIDLKDASVTNKNYVHTQVIDVTLQRNGTDKTGYPWSVGFDINQFPYFGIDNFAHVTVINHNLKRVNISLDETSFDMWLDRIYKRTKPLYDNLREAGPMEPNYIKLVTANREVTYPITQWNQQLEVNDILGDADNIYIQFIRRTNDTDLFLGIAALPVLIV